MDRYEFIPINRALLYWPSDLFDQPEFIDEIGIKNFNVQEDDDSLSVTGTLLWLREISLGIPGIEGFSVALLSSDGFTTAPFDVSILPTFLLRLPSLNASFRIRSDFLIPVKQVGGRWVTDLDSNGNPKTVELTFEGIGIQVDLDGDFEILMPAGAPQANLGAVQLGGTGFVLEIDGVTPYFSRKQTPPEGTAAGFRGLAVESVKLHFPPDLNIPLSQINIENMLIGTGGFSGKITGSGNGEGKIFGIPFELKTISLDFKQNILVGSSLQGTLSLPFFDGPVDVDIGLTDDGDFTVSLLSSSGDGLVELTKTDLLTLKLNSFQFKKETDLFSIQLGGSIKPLFLNPPIDWPEVEVKALTIDSKGHVSIDGGWIEIPKQKSLDFHGFKLELTKIGFGKEADGARWIGLSGGINIVEGIPLKGGVDGLKIIWKDINDIRLQISGINVAFEISGVLNFDGIIFFIDEPDKKGFKGGVKMIIYPLGGMMVDVQFMAGRNSISPPFNFFYLYIGVELPVGIPLGQTGVSLYGMAGLFGYNVMPNKGLPPHEGEAWFEDENGNAGWYKRDTPGISGVEKWTDSRDALALGAGITLGTADNGFTFSGKVLLVVLIPGPMILVEGKAQFLRERKGLDEDPIFRVLAVLDAKSGTFLMNIEAKYIFPPGSGLLVEISGSAEAYFNFNNPNAWHLYLGQETPESKRILAKILSLYYAEAFFMLDAGGVRLGVRAGYNADWKFGPLRIVLQALVEGALGLGTKPTQAYGSLSLLGNVELKAFGKGIGLSIYTGISAQAPTPWYIRGEFSVKLKLPWPLPDPEATIVLEWKEETEPPIPVVLAKIGIEHLKVTEKWELEKYPVYDSDLDGFMDSQGGDGLWTESPIVPLDSRPILTFSRPVQDMPLIGNNSSGVPPAEQIGDYQYNFRLKRVSLDKMEKTGAASWILVADKSEGIVNGTVPLYGDWQVVPNPSQQNIKLMVWSNTPFDISRELENNESFLFSILDSWVGYPCNIDVKPKKIHVDFEKINIGTEYYPVLLRDDFLFVSETNSMEIVKYYADWLGIYSGLTLLESMYQHSKNDRYNNFFIKDTNVSKPSLGIWIVLPDLMRSVEIHFSKGTDIEFKAFSDSGISIYNDTFSIPENLSSDSVRPLLLKTAFPSNPIKAIFLSGNFIILKIDCISEQEWNRVDQNKRIMAHNKTATVENWGIHVGAYLEPNKYYKLSVVTETERIRSDGSSDLFEFNEHAYFQTFNPPGAYEASHSTGEPNNTPQAGSEYGAIEHYPYGGPLKDLSPYIKYTIPGQQVISSNEIKQAASNEPQRPAYRAYDIGVVFNEPQGYVETMYLMADLSLKIKLYDNNAMPVINTYGDPIELDNLWGDNPSTVLTHLEEQWAATLDESTCNITVDKTISNYSSNLYSGSMAMVLKPLTFYKAKLCGGIYPVYEFCFITSRFCTFIHHIHSFNDAAWDHHRLIGSPAEPMLTDDEQTKLENILSSVIEESLKFEQIVGLFDLGLRQLPERVEILVLNDDIGSYGLLLESPEPFDWERLELSVKYSSRSEPIEEFSGNIKIIGANIGAQSINGADYNAEWVDILLIEQSSISGLKIQHKKLGDVDFSVYFEFKDEKVLPAGTVIRIHSGKESTHELPEVEIEHRYRLAEADAGTWQFDPVEEVLQIIDGDNSILHSRSIISYADNNKERFIIHSKDQTRAFIFFPDAALPYSDLLAGRYRLEFQFKRYLSDEKPALKRMGSGNAEETYIEFSLPSFLPQE